MNKHPMSEREEMLALADKIAAFEPAKTGPIVLIARERRMVEAALRGAAASPPESTDVYLKGYAAGLNDGTVRTAAAPLRDAVQYVVDKFKQDEAQGYHTKDRQFAIEILDKALSEPRSFDRSAEPIRNDMRALFRSVDDDDWNWLLSHLNDGGRARFWKAIIADMRGALAVSRTHQCPQETTDG